MKKQHFVIVYILLGALLYVFFFLMNYYTPILEDDCNYALNVDGERLQSFWEIIQTQIWHYQHINGRFFSHTIIQFFCGLTGKYVFNIITPFLWLLIPYVVLLLLKIKPFSEKGIFVYMFITALLCFVIPDQYVAKLMIAGGVNYMWAIMFYVLYLYIIETQVFVRKDIPWYNFFSLLLFSLFVGGFVEFFSIASSPALFFLLIQNRNKISWKQKLILLTFFAGTLFVVLAPSNFVRKALLDSQQQTVSFMKQSLNFFFYFFTTRHIVVLATIVLFEIILNRLKILSVKQFYRENIFYIIALFFSLLFIMVSGAWWGRVFIPYYFISFIIMANMVKYIKLNKRIYWGLSISIMIIVSIDALSEIQVLRDNYQIFRGIENQIVSNKGGLCLQNKQLLSSRMSYASPWHISNRNAKNLWLQGYYQSAPISVIDSTLYYAIKDNQNEISELGFYFDKQSGYYICNINVDNVDYVELIRSEEYKKILRPKFEKLFSTFGLLQKYPIVVRANMENNIFYSMQDVNSTIFYNDYHESFSILYAKFGNYLLVKDNSRWKGILPIKRIKVNYKK